MPVNGGKGGGSRGQSRVASRFSLLSVLLLATIIFTQTAPAKPRCNDASWRTSFTNLASRLLQGELDLAYGRIQDLPLTVTPQTLENIGRLNDRYEPWGGNPRFSTQTGSAGRRR